MCEASQNLWFLCVILSFHSSKLFIMGKNQSKMKGSKIEYEGCAKIMCDKHGDWTCEHLEFWENCGFSASGSFSLNQIDKLRKQLESAETKKRKKKDVGWKAYSEWKAEALLRDIQKNKNSDGGGTKIQCAKFSTGRVHQVPDCVSGRSQPPPYVSPGAGTPQQPPTVRAQAESSDRLYPNLPLPDLDVPTTAPMSARLRSGESRDLLITDNPTSDKCVAPLQPESSNKTLQGTTWWRRFPNDAYGRGS